MKKCIFDENKVCDLCNECNICDLDSNKICDNCGKCIDTNEEEHIFKIDNIYMFEDEYKEE